MAKTKDQFEKDVVRVIDYLKKTDPANATREKAIEMLSDMQALAHLIAHKVVEDEQEKS